MSGLEYFNDLGGESVNLPNFLTLIRLLLIPVFAYFLYNEQYTTAVILFILSGVTDVLDGYIARKYSLVTSWGKFADPLADKLTQVTALVILTIMHKIPWVVVVVIAIKESFMALGGLLIYRRKKFVVQSDWYGKMATVIFYVAVAAIIILDINSMYNNIFIGIAVLSALFAFFMYLLTYIRINKSSG